MGVDEGGGEPRAVVHGVERLTLNPLVGLAGSLRVEVFVNHSTLWGLLVALEVVVEDVLRQLAQEGAAGATLGHPAGGEAFERATHVDGVQHVVSRERRAIMKTHPGTQADAPDEWRHLLPFGCQRGYMGHLPVATHQCFIDLGFYRQ